METRNNTHISVLPHEMLLHVFSFLHDPRDRAAVGLVCSNWNQLAEDDQNYKHQLSYLLGADVDELLGAHLSFYKDTYEQPYQHLYKKLYELLHPSNKPQWIMFDDSKRTSDSSFNIVRYLRHKKVDENILRAFLLGRIIRNHIEPNSTPAILDKLSGVLTHPEITASEACRVGQGFYLNTTEQKAIQPIDELFDRMDLEKNTKDQRAMLGDKNFEKFMQYINDESIPENKRLRRMEQMDDSLGKANKLKTLRESNPEGFENHINSVINMSEGKEKDKLKLHLIFSCFEDATLQRYIKNRLILSKKSDDELKALFEQHPNQIHLIGREASRRVMFNKHKQWDLLFITVAYEEYRNQLAQNTTETENVVRKTS